MYFMAILSTYMHNAANSAYTDSYRNDKKRKKKNYTNSELIKIIHIYKNVN